MLPNIEHVPTTSQLLTLSLSSNTVKILSEEHLWYVLIQCPWVLRYPQKFPFYKII